MLKTDIYEMLQESIKNKNEIEKNIFRLIKGEISLIEARENKDLSDEKVANIIRKIIQGNEETLSYLPNDDHRRDNLVNEIKILKSLLPKTLSKDEVLNEITKNQELTTSIKEAKSDGQATGLAMKFFKTSDFSVAGDVVANVVMVLRSLKTIDEEKFSEIFKNS